MVTSAHECASGDEDFAWLHSWFASMGLSAYITEAVAWCEREGATEIEEVQGIWEELADHLGLDGNDRLLLAPACSSSMQSTALSSSTSASLGTLGTSLPSRIDSAERQISCCDLTETFGDPPYTLHEELGRGANGVVYRCRRDLEQFAAKAIDLKSLRLHANFEHSMHLLNRETSLLLNLRHPRIVKLFDVVDTDAMRFLVMELVEGGDLFNYIIKREGKRMQDQEARHVFLQLIDGLQYIHSKNVVHRDLKPENILISSSFASGFLDVKLSDFGHSKAIRYGHSRAQSVVGTPQYWAPEVVESKSQGYDERADLWSLGVVLYVMLMGKYPFSGSQRASSARSRTSGPGSPRNLGLSFRGNREAEELIRGLIRVKPEERLSLDRCLQGCWLSEVQPMKLQRAASCRAEICVRLPYEPIDVAFLRNDLIDFSCKHKVGASLQILDVVVVCRSGASNDATRVLREELLTLLFHYIPELEQKRSSSLPIDEATASARQEECETLRAIYGDEFEVMSIDSWRVQISDGVVLRVDLPPEYPGAKPPTPSVECRGFVRSVGICEELIALWSPSDVCIYQWTEHLRTTFHRENIICEPSTCDTDVLGEQRPESMMGQKQ